MPVDPNDAAIVKTILAMEQSLAWTVASEGVEASGRRDILVGHG